MDAIPSPHQDRPPASTEPETKSDAGPEIAACAQAQPRYSIAAVSKLTGISCHTLRVWERRYGFPAPERSASGHRRYDRQQMQLLCRVSELNRSSRLPIGELISQIRATTAEPEEPATAMDDRIDQEVRAKLVCRLVAGETVDAEREYAAFAGRFDPLGLVDQVIHPALIEAGEGWFRKSYSVFEERLITVFLRQKLINLIEAARQANRQPAHTIIAGTVQGDRHEGGVLMFNLIMELRGWRVYNLGVDLPVSEYSSAVQSLHPSALALSFVLSRNIKKRFQELRAIRSVPIFVGGRSIVNYQSVARSHGLIPLIGPLLKSTERLQADFNLWVQRHAQSG